MTPSIMTQSTITQSTMTYSINYETYETYAMDELHNLLDVYDNLLTETKEEPFSEFNSNIIAHFEKVVLDIRTVIRTRS